MSRMVSTIMADYTVASWTGKGEPYAVSVKVWPRGEIHAFCDCPAFRNWCKHAEQVWTHKVLPVLRDQGRNDLRRPEWPRRPEWCTAELIAEHDEMTEGHPAPPEYDGDPFDGLSGLSTADLMAAAPQEVAR